MKPSPPATERALARCIRRAVRDGLVIVFDAKTVPDVGTERGVCAMGAYERLGRRAPVLRLPRSPYALARAYDAIEAGFDGNETAGDEDERPLPRMWIEVGLRLRATFEPVAADDLLRRIEVEEQDRIGGLIRFTTGPGEVAGG